MTLALVDNLPPGPAALAVGLTPIRFTTSPARDAGLLAGHTLLVRSPRLAEVGPSYFGKTAAPRGPIPGIFDYAGAYMRERVGAAALWGVRIPYAHALLAEGRARGTPARQAAQRALRCWPRTRSCTPERGLQLRRARGGPRLAQERGYAVVLYDQPLNASAAGPDWAGVVPAYRKRAAALAARLRRALHPHRAPRRARGRRLRRPLPSARTAAALKWQPEHGAPAARRQRWAVPHGGAGARRRPTTRSAAAAAAERRPAPPSSAAPESRAGAALRRAARSAPASQPPSATRRVTAAASSAPASASSGCDDLERRVHVAHRDAERQRRRACRRP